jgi:spermidine synthase
VAFLGLGTGISAGAALDHPFDDLLAIEIVPDVVTAAREDFSDWNVHLLEDPRVRVAVGDGRLALKHGGPFDVVVGDLLVPWRPGEGPLYAREHFQTVRGALAPGGLFCQWLPVYQLSQEQLAIAARTFVDVFPDTTLWRGNFLPEEATLALVGQLERRPLLVDGVDRRVEALKPRLNAAEPFLHHPAGVWLHLVAALTPDDPWLSGAPLNTDAHPWLELSGPRGLDQRGRFARGPLAGLYGDPLRDQLESSPLARLDAAHREWWATGLSLTLAMALPREAAADRVLATLRTLPRELREALGVEESRDP